MTNKVKQMLVVEEVSNAEREAVIDVLVAFNNSKAPKENHKEIERYLRTNDGKIVGGAIGYTHWGWLFVKQLWVDETCRGNGAGKKLMMLLEIEARNRGCEWVWLDTFDFQALPFYKKLGFNVFAELDDFPQGHKRFFLKKKLIEKESKV